jgi:hypothetical protein
MADAPTADALSKMLNRLPRDEDATGNIAVRVRLTTNEGRTFFAFARAGEGPLSFTGWEVHGEMTGEEEWDYFVIGAQKAGDPLQVVSRNGPLGILAAAELEERGE